MPTQKHRIMYIITRSDFGGAQSYVFDLAQHSKLAGYEVLVVCGGKGELIDKLESAEISVRIIDSFVRDLSIAKEFQTLAELRKAISEFKPDIVHINSSKAGVLGTLASRLEKVEKIVFTAHGWPFFEKRSQVWRTLAWCGSYLTTLLANKTICVSLNDARNSGFPFLQKKLTLVYNGAHTPNLLDKETATTKIFTEETLSATTGFCRLISIGELTGNKNYIAVLAALNHLQKKNPDMKLHYSIMGSGDLESQLYGYIKKSGLESRVSLLGFTKEPYQYLKAFDAIIMPSKKEGLPYTLINSALVGIPILAANVGGIPEIVRKTRNGRLVDTNKQTELVAAITDIYQQWQAGELTWTNNPEAQKYFSIEKMIENTFLIYNE